MATSNVTSINNKTTTPEKNYPNNKSRYIGVFSSINNLCMPQMFTFINLFPSIYSKHTHTLTLGNWMNRYNKNLVFDEIQFSNWIAYTWSVNPITSKSLKLCIILMLSIGLKAMQLLTLFDYYFGVHAATWNPYRHKLLTNRTLTVHRRSRHCHCHCHNTQLRLSTGIISIK